MSQSIFCSKILKPTKNDRRICPINDAPTSTLTLATPKNHLSPRRSPHHDA